MKKLSLTVSILAVLVLSGCATTNNLLTSMKPAKPSADESATAQAERKDSNKAAAKKGAAKGCAVGGLLGFLKGGLGNAVKGCVAGGVVVGGAAWYTENQKQLKAANALADEARTLGATASVEEKTVEVKNETTGVVDQVTTLDRLTIEFPAQRLAERAPAVEALIAKAATMADASAVPVTISVYGRTADRLWVSSRLAASLKADTATTVVEGTDQGVARLELTPVPAL